MGKDNYKMRREAFKFWDSVRLILETLRYLFSGSCLEHVQLRHFNQKDYKVRFDRRGETMFFISNAEEYVKKCQHGMKCWLKCTEMFWFDSI